MKIAIVLGTRPEIIKLAPIIKKLGPKRSTVIFTGQHYDFQMGRQFIQELELPKPNYSLKISKSTPQIQISEIINKLSKILSKEKPDSVMVQGDTNTVLAAGICSIKSNIPITHVESGLRSNDWRMPEEHNRIAIDHLSEILFAPTLNAKKNLLSESVHGKIHVTGNTAIDAISIYSKISEKKSKLSIDFEEFILFTLHRAENVDDKKILSSIINGIINSEEKIIFPIHPRTKKRLIEFNLFKKLQNNKNFGIYDSLGYFDMLELMKKCSLIVTDSGGIQEESTAPIIRKKVLVVRKTTDRPEAVDSKMAEVIGTNQKIITQKIKKSINNPSVLPRNAPYGKGLATSKIIKILTKNY
ncbi:non-hydrolyzing UDP-N-acetylglucosamine 2-epimerase [Nitrosopumilus sp.]|uniref:non-hydrolyzing UDP-N-acetylglucosamine 2-epimerase n=1 Tax=Nitrosopumilus sp. TaxID=2024843 RepID=UPI00260B0635|nr:UDP-N-acetylglucosamine 2-epimerase (non-hydrolyzing) [Nitrosopumilus sp.]